MKRHGFSSTHIEHFDDGSSSIHHMHSDPAKDVKHACMDLDDVHDSMQTHLNPEKEQELEEKIHPGIHAEVMKMAEKE